MNRIREYGDKFQVLVTPMHYYNVSFEIMMGGWTDERLRNYYILEFDSKNDALYEASKYPDLDWEKLVLNFKHAYNDFKDKILDVLQKNQFNATFNPVMMTPTQAKNAMFNRVMNSNNNFTLLNQMNDVIHYIITNPWTQNCISIANALIGTKGLRLIKQAQDNGAIILIGKTDLGLSYRISIFPSMIHQWYEWSNKNPNVDSSTKKAHLGKMIELQKKVDSDYMLR